MFSPTAQIIADSVNTATGDRLTTFVLEYHRIIHDEFLTYRMFSRNSASNRAIPTRKLIDKVKNNNLYPLHWGKNQKGMVAEEELAPIKQEIAKALHDELKSRAIEAASVMFEMGVHKQVANRYLEPFSTISTICTATNNSYQHFFDERVSAQAQPEIQALAEEMQFLIAGSEPKPLNPGEWHLPFYNPEIDKFSQPTSNENLTTLESIRVSTARSARVSYLNHFGIRDVDDDLRLSLDLLRAKPRHLSPFEHPAMAAKSQGSYANFSGWKSYRYLIEKEKGFIF